VRNLALVAIAAYFGISALVSTQPEWFEFIQRVPGRDKLLHCLGAGFLSVVIIGGFSCVVFRSRTYGSFLLLGATALLIALEELGQLAIASRTFDLADLGWSYLGLSMFGLPAIWLKQIRGSAG